MNYFYRIVTGRPVFTLAVVLLATVYVGSGIRFLETLNNEDSELPKSDPIVRTNDRLKAVFGDKADLLIGIEADDVFTPATLRKVAELSERLKTVEGVIEDEIVSLTAVNNIEGREWGLDVGPLVDEVPETPEAITRLKTAVRANPLLNGKLVSEDGTLTLIRANVEKGRNEELTFRQLLALVQAFSGPERIHLAGNVVQPQEVDQGIQSDLQLLLPAVLVMTLIGFYVCFRTWRGVWLPFSVVVLSVIWTMGLTGHVGLPMTVVSSAVPILMVAISSSYGIHVLHHYYEAIRRVEPQPARAGLEKVTPAIVMVGVVSALGSASLLTFPVTSIRGFGIITTMGTLATALVCLTYTPAVLALLKPGQLRAAQSSTVDDRLAGLARFSVRHRRSVLAGAVIVFAISLVGVSHIEIGTDILKYFPEGHRLRTAAQAFNAGLGGARRLDVMVEGGAADAVKDPELLRKIQRFQEYAEGLPGVGTTSSFADIVRRIHQEMNEGNPAYHVIPESRDLIAQYLLLYSISGDPADFAEIVDYDYQRTKIRITLTTSRQAEHRHVYEALHAYAATEFGPQARLEFGGDIMFWLAQIHHIAVGKVYNILTGIAFVLLLCGLTFRSVTAGLFSILPLMVSTTLTFGLMGFVGIRLEAATAIITSIAVGVGVDFALHYLINFRQELRNSPARADIEEIAMRVFMTGGKPILFDMVANILGFSVLVFSGFLPIRYFGWLISLTMLTVGIATLLLMPALIAVFRPRFLIGREAGASTSLPMNAAGSRVPGPRIATIGVLLLAFVGMPSVGSAQDVRVTGRVETDHIAYFEPGETDQRAGRNEMLAQIDGLVPFGRTFRLFGSVELRTDFENHARDRLYVDELYAEVVHGRFDLRVGRQIIAWGKTDLVNPTDHLSPRDFTDPLESDEERIGVLAVRPRVQWGSLQWEGAIVPVFTGSIMPPRRSRWSPPLPPRAQNPSQPEQVMRLEYELLPPQEPATTLENMQYATRLSGSVRGWDVSASYFDGWDDVPRFVTQVTVSSPGISTVRITPEHLRKRVIGGDVATVVGPFTVRAEAAHIRPHSRQGPQYFQYVLGAERTFGDMMASGGTFVLVQWIHSVLPGEFDAAPLEFDYLFKKATMTRVQHNVTVAFQIGVEGLYEWERGGYYLQPVASYRFGGRVRIEGLIDLLGGRQDEFFGLFGDNRRFQSRVRYSF